MIKNNRKKICSIMAFFGMFVFFLLNVGQKEVMANPYYNPYEYVQTYGTDSCRFAVVEGDGRIYLSSYGKTGSKNYARYYTIGWKANLYLNGQWQESIYFSLEGSYITHLTPVTVNGVEYNLDYIRTEDLKNRFKNQSAINSGAGEIRLDSVMTVKNGGTDTPNGWIDDQGNRGGEVYEDYNGIANARGWSSQTMTDLHSNFDKTPTGMYFTVTVSGGTGISNVYGGGKYIYGATAIISADCATGYDFNTWSNGKTTSRFVYKVTDNASFSCTGKAKKYTVSYDANGGQGAPGNQTKTYGSVLTLSGTKPTRTGYNFSYWDSSSDGKTYGAGAGYGTDADSKMTANWSPIQYKVEYKTNKPDKASSSVTGTTATSTHYYDTPKTVTTNGYSLKGWTFTSWNNKADGSGSTTYNGGYVTNLTTTNNATVPLYAQWKPNVYMLVLDEQYATVSGTSVIYEKYDHAWYKEKTTETTITKISTPSKIGMKFNGYFTEKDGKGTKYINADGTIVAKSNAFTEDGMRVYAYWTPDVYDITLDNQGATTSGTAHIYEKYGVGFYTSESCDSKFTNGKIAVPKKDNYTFGGYYTEQNTWKTSNGDEIISTDGTIKDVNTRFTEDATLYAKWIPVDYTINLDNCDADIAVGSDVFHEKYGEYNYTSHNVADSSLGRVTETFSYTGDVQYFIAPYTGTYTLEVAGAQGASVGATGGKGGTSKGTVELQQGEILAVVVGGAGNNVTGGYNLGGDGWIGSITSEYGGGGATDIRRGGGSTDDRIIVAGGGGGTATYNHISTTVNGTDGGGETGGRIPFVALGYTCYVSYDTTSKFDARTIYTGKLQSSGANQTSGYTQCNNEEVGFKVTDRAWIIKIDMTDKGEKSFATGGGGYYSGGYITGNLLVCGGLGGSGYIGGVTNGSMTTGTNSGNGWAKITYTKYSSVDSASTSIIVPQKTGCTFGGYWTKQNGQGFQCISELGEITTEPTYFNAANTTKNQTTIYAFWTDNSYRVIYDANGGVWQGHTETSTSDEVKYNASYTVKNNMFSRDGYTFVGWSEKKDGSDGVSAWMSGKTKTYSKVGNTTLYAQWKAENVSYTVNYYLQNLDGTYSKSTPYVGKGASDSIVTPEAKAFTGFEFDKTKSASTPVGTKNDDGTISVVIKGDGSTVVNYQSQP